MQVCGAFAQNDGGEERYFAILLCGCNIPIPILEIFENDIPCPLHEEWRYTGEEPPVAGSGV